ncbi:MAG: hypothetical protein K2M82_03105, partial [Lachnospiraceae bacterium]|nr:hypothetical protein [Lachnospiraceae bacterium]
MQDDKIFLDSLKKTELFHGISDTDIKQMLVCFDGKKRTFTSGQMIFNAGDKISQMGIVMTGRVYMETKDVTGN